MVGGAGIEVNTGLDAIPSARELARGLFGFEGPRTLIVSWAIVGAVSYVSSAVGLIVMILVALFATFMIGVGFLWLGIRMLRG